MSDPFSTAYTRELVAASHPSPAPGHLASAACAEVLNLGAELAVTLERLVRRYGNVTLMQYRALAQLHERHPEPMEPWELARSLTTGSAHVTAILDHLATQGLVERAPHERDRRRRLVRLTGEGLARIERLAPEVRALEERLLGQALTPGEHAALAELARRVRRTLAELSLPATGRAGP